MNFKTAILLIITGVMVVIGLTFTFNNRRIEQLENDVKDLKAYILFIQKYNKLPPVPPSIEEVPDKSNIL